MKKSTKLECKIIVFRKVLHIYYSYQGDKLRYSTGITPKDEKKHQRELLVQKGRIDSIIQDYFIKNNRKPTVQYIKDELKKEVRVDTNLLLDHFDDYYTFIQNKRMKKSSLKDYKSCQNSLISYQIIKKVVLTLEDLTPDFLRDYEIFLAEKHSTSAGEEKVKTKGELNNNTIRKRFDVLRSFFRYLVNQKGIRIEKEVLKPNTVSRYDNDPEVLTREELEYLYTFTPSTDNLGKVRDIFLFGCMTSLRYSDIVSLTKDNIRNNIIEKVPQKSKKQQEKYLVPLNDTALTILEKYNYNLNIFSNQVFNRLLKDLMKETGKFDNIVTKSVYQLEFEKKVSCPRWKLISSHTSRRTFITNCIINGVPIGSLMGMTSHKKVDTLMKYVNKYGNDNLKFVNKLQL
ncbi:MAG: tyrosine-type recombinase/integrase [Bacteroidota bacterium]